MKNFQLLFSRDVETFNVFSLENIYKYPTINEYLGFLKNVSEAEIRKKIIKIICNKTDIIKKNDEEINKLASSNEITLDYVKYKDIDVSLKWEIFCILNDKENYINDFIKFMKEYVNIYKPIETERNKELLCFNNHVIDNIHRNGVDYLKTITRNCLDFEKFKNIYVTSSALVGIIVKVLKNDSCYVILGSGIEDVLENMNGRDKTEGNLAVFKQISDNTRFSIVKLLLKRDYYGLELSEALGITTSTVSYHMGFLVYSGIVRAEKKDHKAYYSLNKDRLIESIKFLNKELELQM